MRNQSGIEPPPNPASANFSKFDNSNKAMGQGNKAQYFEENMKEAKDHVLILMNERSSEVECANQIKDVWLDNFFVEMEKVSSLIDDYPYISMDTEFPGTVYLPLDTENEFEYQIIRANCDNLKLIQVGICLTNEQGVLPNKKVHAWQFNLEFDIKSEESRQSSMDLLRESGLDLPKHKQEGIPHNIFAEYMITSGLLLNPNCHWITFQGGTDFGYLLKYLRGGPLPTNEKLFVNEMKIYF